MDGNRIMSPQFTYLSPFHYTNFLSSLYYLPSRHRSIMKLYIVGFREGVFKSLDECIHLDMGALH